MQKDSQPKPNHQVNLRLDLRVVVGVLLMLIVVMLIFWHPWDGTRSDRTIDVSGQASVTAVPDEFVFYPTYQFKNTDPQAALDAASKKSEELVAKVKELGVPEKKIKTNTSSYDRPLPNGVDDETNYTLSLTITVESQELAQKVQDYLATTAPTGSVSPQLQFSDQKQKELEAQARDAATKDARAKAEQSAQNLGFSVGKVKKVSDGNAFGYPSARDTASSTEEKLTLHPGENEITYTVMVAFFVQ